MNKKLILFGSILAVVIIVLASFPSVVGYQTIKFEEDTVVNPLDNEYISKFFLIGIIKDLSIEGKNSTSLLTGGRGEKQPIKTCFL